MEASDATIAVSRAPAIGALIAPFERSPRDNGWPEHLWRDRRRILAALTEIMCLTDTARHSLDWFHLNKNSDEKAAIAPLTKLHRLTRELFDSAPQA